MWVSPLPRARALSRRGGVPALFSRYDENSDGFIDRAEWAQILHENDVAPATAVADLLAELQTKVDEHAEEMDGYSTLVKYLVLVALFLVRRGVARSSSSRARETKPRPSSPLFRSCSSCRTTRARTPRASARREFGARARGRVVSLERA